ncbi:hypothetical protein D3C86_862180 [compost metagenome]
MLIGFFDTRHPVVKGSGQRFTGSHGSIFGYRWGTECSRHAHAVQTTFSNLPTNTLSQRLVLVGYLAIGDVLRELTCARL